MSYPTIKIGNKKIILLSGFERVCGANKTLAITAKDISLKRPPGDTAMRSHLVTSQACG